MTDPFADLSLDPIELTANYPNRLLPTGEWAAIETMLFTTALCVGVTPKGYRTRFCFETRGAAEASLAEWDGAGFPPGWWVKQKPEGIPNPARQR